MYLCAYYKYLFRIISVFQVFLVCGCGGGGSGSASPTISSRAESSVTSLPSSASSLSSVATSSISSSIQATTSSVGQVSLKARLINLTDLGADPDDQQSMVHQLAFSNEIELEGLIVSTSCWRKNQNTTLMLDKILSAYGQALPNLRKHADGYPSLEYLKSISVMGQLNYGMDDVGLGKDSAGSNLIINAADKADARPLWVACWGGCNTLAQAVWNVQHSRTPAELGRFISKLRVYDVLGQDNSGAWLAKNFPSLLYIRATGVYGWAASDAWLASNIQNKGFLGQQYPNRAYATEGDSPAFMHLIPNGLNDPEKIDQGGLGGRFDLVKTSGLRGMSCMSGEEAQYDPYFMFTNDSQGSAAISRWSPSYDNDFQARMDWSVKNNYSEANHPPVAVVNNDRTKEVVYLSAAPGSSIELNANGSTDPDGDSLQYSWTYYAEPSSYPNKVFLQNSFAPLPSLTIPSNAIGKSMHIILAVTDKGSPNLTAYRRVVINVQ